jgi:UPF0716 protein FxsA
MRTQKQTTLRPWLGLILLGALIGIPLIEIALFIKIGGWIGLGPTLALIVLTAVVGVGILRRQGLNVLLRAQRQLTEGVLPVVEVFEGLCLVIAGALLLTPGFFTDALGALLLLPPVRWTLYRQVRQRIESHLGPGGPDTGTAGDTSAGPTIEGEFEEIAESREPDRMPSPRGSWRPRP